MWLVGKCGWVSERERASLREREIEWEEFVVSVVSGVRVGCREGREGERVRGICGKRVEGS